MSEITVTYRNVRRIDDAQETLDEDDDLPDGCGMASPDGGLCDHDADYAYELVVDGEEKEGVRRSCTSCLRLPRDPDFPLTFSRTYSESDLYA